MRQNIRLVMGVCLLNLSGISFAVDEFLKHTQLKPKSFYRKGEVLPCETEPRPDSGVLLLVSDQKGNPLDFHIKEAMRFLGVHEPKLRSATEYGVDDMRLVFTYHRQQTTGEIEFLPPKLLALAGNLGIGIAIFSVQLP